MKFSAKLMSLLIIVIFSSIVVLNFSLPFVLKYSANPMNSVLAKTQVPGKFDLGPNQSFSSAAGSTIAYNVYIENEGKSIASYTLTTASDKGYYVEVWQDTDQIGSGDIQLLPSQEPTVTIGAGEVATLIVKVTVPLNAADGTVDNTLIKVLDSGSGSSASVMVTTTVNSNLIYPSNWVQLGSDPTFPISVPQGIDIKSFYYTNNDTNVFFKMAEVSKPNTIAFRHSVYLDTKTGGQLIDGCGYDYLLSSDGILYEWNGSSWINSGYLAYWQVNGTEIVLWTNLNNISLDLQEIHVLPCTTTKDYVLKDKLGPYTILRSTISEVPLLLMPVLGITLYFTISRRIRKNARKI